MKRLKSIYVSLLTVGTLFFTSCNVNDVPKFSDSDAFVAFTNATMSVGENKETLAIPVLLSSLSGISTTVDFEITTEGTTAVEGTHYTLANASHTLTFTKEAPTQVITLNIIDNATFNGDVKLNIVLKNPADVNLGSSKTCSVTIEDDEHPLLFILGSFTGTGESNFGGALEWNLVIEKDAEDLSKVWITNLVPNGTSLKVYGTVNAEKTEIHIPVGQEIAKSSSYPHILLEGFYGKDGEEDIPTGGYITGIIAENGTITIQDWFGSCVYTDDAATASAGWYEIVMSGAVWKK